MSADEVLAEVTAAAEEAWRRYRDDLLANPHSGIYKPRQLRRRDFITGYLVGNREGSGRATEA